MLEADGGFETVKRILAGSRPSDGFQKLWELGHLELTCEAIIVESKWRQYFDDDLLQRAERLLREMKYPFKRFELSAQLSETLPALGDSAGNTDSDPTQEEFAGASSESSYGIGATLRINAFFRDVLHAPVANVRWSWGAVDERTRRLFLRLWRTDIKTVLGIQQIRVLSNSQINRPGRSERARHLELIRSGYAAFAVVCDKESPEAGSILGFDHDRLLRLGRVIEEDGVVSMEILGSIAIEALGQIDASADALKSDFTDIEQADVAATTRSALVEARLGQGRFRRELMRRWDGACAVTGCRVAAVLRASHCKPWRKSDDSERLDSNNGLVLSANLDALFDVGLISFGDDGGMIVADVLTPSERGALDIPAGLTRNPSAKLKTYLKFHRDHVFLGR
ncbi:MAG: HNH endonuclease signature motif containing protein [Rhodanobacter sp.]